MSILEYFLLTAIFLGGWLLAYKLGYYNACVKKELDFINDIIERWERRKQT